MRKMLMAMTGTLLFNRLATPQPVSVDLMPELKMQSDVAPELFMPLVTTDQCPIPGFNVSSQCPTEDQDQINGVHDQCVDLVPADEVSDCVEECTGCCEFTPGNSTAGNVTQWQQCSPTSTDLPVYTFFLIEAGMILSGAYLDQCCSPSMKVLADLFAYPLMITGTVGAICTGLAVLVGTSTNKVEAVSQYTLLGCGGVSMAASFLVCMTRSCCGKEQKYADNLYGSLNA